jgi:uncharacterized protein YdcH (DUF465 family)
LLSIPPEKPLFGRLSSAEEVSLMSHTEVRDRLLREDSSYQRLVRKHEEYDRRLQSLQSQRYLSDDEKLEEVTLKKRKLLLKDEMEAMVLNSTRS